MARTTKAQREAQAHAAKPLHFQTTGGGKPPICGIPRTELPYSAYRGIHVAFVSEQHLTDPMVCPDCVAALPTADASLPGFMTTAR
jgi:hypothetical protein